MNIKKESLTKISSFVLIFSLIFFQRISIPILSFQLPLALLLTYLFIIVNIANSEITIRLDRQILLFASIVFLSLSIIFVTTEYSIFSYFYVVLAYIPFIFVFNKLRDRRFLLMLHQFQVIMLFAAGLGLAQFVGQFFGLGKFDPFLVLPARLVQEGYNTVYPIHWSISLCRSNAFIFLEPSFCSQAAALAIIFEMLFFKRVQYLLVYGMLLCVTFSGTGILLLLFSVFVFPQMRKKNLVFLTIIWVVIAFVFNQVLPVDYIDFLIKRSSEFTSETSSGYVRFNAPFQVLWVTISNNLGVLLHGMGPGTSEKMVSLINTSYPPIPKLIIEYGIVSGLGFLTFICFSFFRGSQNKRLSLVFLFYFLFVSASLLQPQTVNLIYILFLIVPKDKIVLELKRKRQQNAGKIIFT